MRWPKRPRTGLLLMLELAMSVPAAATVLTGQVRSAGAQHIYTPPSMSSPVVLRYFVEDGEHVHKGQPVLRIDASQAEQQLQTLADKIDSTRIKVQKEVADLELKRVDAELAWVKAEAAMRTAAVDAAIPKRLITALDYDRYQGTYTKTQREAALARKKLADARKAVADKRRAGKLEVQKSQLSLSFNRRYAEGATVKAARDGTVVHLFQTNFMASSTGSTRYEEGSTSYPGEEVGQVVNLGGRHTVRAWALEPDRKGLHQGQTVYMHFDALPGSQVTGTITHISGIPAAKPEWGEGAYYSIDIQPDKATSRLSLLPGMSVRVDTQKPQAHVAVAQHQGTIQATGSVYARKTINLMPPAIPGVFQLTISQMVDDGATVKKGQQLVVFSANDLMQKLPGKRSELAEKKRAQEQLRLTLADKAKQAALATAQAKADDDKARRKASQPKDYIAGIDYKKLLIDRDKADQVLKLTRERQRVAAEDRQAQQRQADAEVKQVTQQVARMRKSVAALQIHAPRAGVFLHGHGFDGSSLDTGSQVWRGVSVANMPDMHSLAVRASLPERDLHRVRTGEAVSVVLAGGSGRHLDGHIQSIGHSVHSKSRAEPVPVVDLDINLDHAKGVKLKPGQPVQVEIAPQPVREVASR
ncbi:HlyD family efflux transporter periplasmic adaptor subunit [Oleiagrimonas sp. C23AA]|uniref:HlyD family secretion protein n=1 Tax=Oleiagrimonas sp. C23AA TaxID=2719047 RepID=UPI0014208C24|nr:HlyD family efflux transporter periplasmic adaptor subunit [Oleiagrimonas sp. C23AA]NII12264.1 HlyD family efflux transporter periplasmic adaptor subunit [Oleiagrimonas sp. C23AA]